ncbi:MAG: hypothetical protein U9R57_10205 [Thermodesulfobacteriota bacterium]|nr:hypothetical protein [Thermodesulfobacteriota bacterium]
MNKFFVIPMAFFSVVMWSQVTVAESLNLSKSDSLNQDECVVSGEDITYNICYDNPNSYDVDDVILTDVLPDDTSFVSVSEGSSGVYDASTHSVTWDIGLLDKESENTCVQLTINVTALPGTVLTNQVTIKSSNEELPPMVDEPTVIEEDTGICSVAVHVDIKPGGCPTPINVGSKGVLPVAVSGTADFDVTTIDPTSITLAGVLPLRWAMEDVATPYAINVDGCNIDDCHELAGDGYLDLTLKFDTQEIYAAIAEVYDRECLILTLTGKLKTAYGELPIKGGDVVSILKKGRKHKVAPTSFLLLK